MKGKRHTSCDKFKPGRAPKGFMAVGLIALGILASVTAWPCSDIMLPAPHPNDEDKTAVSARTMDFELNLHDFLEVVPRGREMTSPDPDANHHAMGMSWKTDYGFVGISVFWHQYYERGNYLEGMNEHGLSAGLLWLDDSYRKEKGHDKNGYPDPKVGEKNLSIQSVVSYLLGRCKSVPEAIQALEEVNVWHEMMPVELPFYGNFSPTLFKMPLAFHLVLHDANHTSAVVEWLDKKQNIYPSSAVGVVTNDPAYPRQLEQLKMFEGLTSNNGFKVPPDDNLTENDQNLPGDSWSSSRFVRVSKLTNSALNSYRPLALFAQTPKLWRVQQANRIIGRAEEVYGEIFHKMLDFEIMNLRWENPFHTIYTVIRDHTNCVLYFRGVYNAAMRKVDLTKLAFDRPNKYGLSWMFVDPNSANPGYYLDFAQDTTSILSGVDAKISGLDALPLLTIDYTFRVSRQDLAEFGSSDGEIFIFRRDTDGELFYWDARSRSWVQSKDMILRPSYSGKLTTMEFNSLFQNAFLKKYSGTKIYAGYGTNQTEMLMNGRYGLVYVVQNPPYY